MFFLQTTINALRVVNREMANSNVIVGRFRSPKIENQDNLLTSRRVDKCSKKQRPRYNYLGLLSPSDQIIRIRCSIQTVKEL